MMTESLRPCPRCASQPTGHYEYRYGTRVYCLLYCSACRKTYNRAERRRRPRADYRTPIGPRIPNFVRGPEHAGEVRYEGAHDRVVRAYGPAKLHQCAKCSRPAAQWALDPNADERWLRRGHRPGRGNTEVTWSLDVRAYRPLCVPCHQAETDDDLTSFKRGAQDANRRRQFGFP